MVYINPERNKFDISNVGVADKTYYLQILRYCEDNNIEYDASKGILNDLASRFGLKFFEDVADNYGYARHNCMKCSMHEYKRNTFDSLPRMVTTAFLIDFGSWIWAYNTERNISVRRIWYLRYKQLVQILFMANHHIKTPFNEYYAGLLSKELWKLVQNNPELYYESFAVKDMSRQVWSAEAKGWKNIIVLGEKDATTPFFEETCKILGISVLFSGKGKTSAAAVEVVYNDMVSRKFDHDTPIYVFTLTDWDEDGLLGVESGFLKQVETYAKRFDYEIVHKRVGIFPDDLDDADKSPYEKCFILPKQNTAWARENGIEFHDSDGSTKYLGIELEALPTAYFYNRILEACYEFFTQEEMSNFVRVRSTPSEYSYEEESDSVAQIFLENNSYEYKELDFIINLYQRKITECEREQNDLLEPIKHDIWEQTKSVLDEPNWDDRQREWDENAEKWDEDSVEEMHDNHKVKIEAAVRSQRQFFIWNSGLGFEVSQLTDKFKNMVSDKLNNGEITLDIDESEFNNDADDFETYILPSDTTEYVKETLDKLSEIPLIKSLLRSTSTLLKLISKCEYEEEVAGEMGDKDYQIFTKIMDVLNEHEYLINDEEDEEYEDEREQEEDEEEEDDDDDEEDDDEDEEEDEEE